MGYLGKEGNMLLSGPRLKTWISEVEWQKGRIQFSRRGSFLAELSGRVPQHGQKGCPLCLGLILCSWNNPASLGTPFTSYCALNTLAFALAGKLFWILAWLTSSCPRVLAQMLFSRSRFAGPFLTTLVKVLFFQAAMTFSLPSFLF